MNEGSQTTRHRFEIERDGEIAFLGYENYGDGWISLLHTWVPPALPHRGIATELAQIALEYAKENQLKVEVVCPIVFHFLTKHPEYKPLVAIRGNR